LALLKLTLTFLLLSLSLVSISFQKSQAQTPEAAAAETDPGSKIEEAVARQEAVEKKHFQKWESGFDFRLTEIDGSSSWFLGAQWYRKYKTGTQLGLSLSSLPLPRERKEDDIKTRTMLYYYGLAIEQRIIEYGYFRLSFGISYNYGSVYQRVIAFGSEDEFFSADITVLEPAVYVFVYSYKSLDMGFSVSQRLLKFVDKKDGDEEKFAGLAYGLSFRQLF
jgi:hypothetical protein